MPDKPFTLTLTRADGSTAKARVTVDEMLHLADDLRTIRNAMGVGE